MQALFAPAICVIIPRNHGRVETSPQLPHRVFAERRVLILRPSRRQGRAQNNCSYENHFWWIFISTTRRWRTEYKDFWAQTLCCGNVKIKMSVRLCYNKSFELRSRFRIIWQRWRRGIPWIWSSEVFLNRIILRSGNQLLTTWLLKCFKVSESNNSDVRGFLWSSCPLHNFFKWHVFRSIPPLTHHEFGKW